MKRSHVFRATLAANATYWRRHINARNQRPAHGVNDLHKTRKGPCQALVQRASRSYRAS